MKSSDHSQRDFITPVTCLSQISFQDQQDQQDAKVERSSQQLVQLMARQMLKVYVQHSTLEFFEELVLDVAPSFSLQRKIASLLFQQEGTQKKIQEHGLQLRKIETRLEEVEKENESLLQNLKDKDTEIEAYVMKITAIRMEQATQMNQINKSFKGSLKPQADLNQSFASTRDSRISSMTVARHKPENPAPVATKPDPNPSGLDSSIRQKFSKAIDKFLTRI